VVFFSATRYANPEVEEVLTNLLGNKYIFP
jgi:hypothetical protein